MGEIGTARAQPGHRMEHDLLGELTVPGDAYYGVHTTRALCNFAVSGIPIGHHPALVTALAAVKQAAANRDLGRLTDADAAAILQACADIRGGALHEQFVVDVIQGGAGTSTNMNANEVIANRALELLGHPRGDYARLHPLDQVNAGQSTNDVYPTAARIAVWSAAEPLLTQLGHLRQVCQVQADRFRHIIKMGRTQLQDAVPMTLGQELAAWAVTIGEDIDRLVEVRAVLGEVNMGGTAIGTGLNADPQFSARAVGYLRELTGIPLTVSPDLVEATQDAGAFVYFSGMLKRIAVKLSKICNDLRLLSSGPAAGFGDIALPAVQAGSSIMPGKINPVIPELVNQIAFTVIGQDLTITMAAEAGQLQLNAFEPVMVHCLLTGLHHLSAGVGLLADRCLTGITANEAALRETAASSAGLATALSPYLGYAAAGELAREAQASNRPVRELATERGLLPPEVIDALLADPYRLTGTAGPQHATATRQPAGTAYHNRRRNNVSIHTRIRPFSTRDTYPEQNLDNDLCQAVIAGDTIYLRGQIGQNLDTSENVGVGDVTAQAEQAMTNIDLLLREAGSALQDIVKVTVYLTDPRYREPVYRVMGRWLKGVYPVSTGLVVSALARPEWLVEIDATAVRSATS